MASAITFLTTHPTTGQVATRTSKTMNYTFAVWGRRTTESIRKEYANYVKHGFGEKWTTKLEEFEKNPQPGEWFVLHWCGRRDLAEKAAKQHSGTTDYSRIYEIVISEATAKGKGA